MVGEVLKGQGDFVEMEHYPRDDVFDVETHGQYYYHAHRGGDVEHGHFHTFLRAGGMPAGVAPLDDPQASEPWPQGDDAICHLVAIAMDAWGDPIGLFCVNRWVADETWYLAEAVIAMLDRFAIDHAFPNWAVNRWLTALLRLYRPHIEALIRQGPRRSGVRYEYDLNYVALSFVRDADDVKELIGVMLTTHGRKIPIIAKIGGRRSASPAAPI